jgi:hypothetical protein
MRSKRQVYLISPRSIHEWHNKQSQKVEVSDCILTDDQHMIFDHSLLSLKSLLPVSPFKRQKVTQYLIVTGLSSSVKNRVTHNTTNLADSKCCSLLLLR